MDNLIPLLERWNAPISLALHAPGTDFTPTIETIKYLRKCMKGSDLVRKFATFHIYFHEKHIPNSPFISNKTLIAEEKYKCPKNPPYVTLKNRVLYKTSRGLLYPVNIGRNIARDAAMTHFNLASDIELYPSLGLINDFLEMIASNSEYYLQRPNRKVYPLAIFEIEKYAAIPNDKRALQKLIKSDLAVIFHKYTCAHCHRIPKADEWLKAEQTNGEIKRILFEFI